MSLNYYSEISFSVPLKLKFTANQISIFDSTNYPVKNFLSICRFLPLPLNRLEKYHVPSETDWQSLVYFMWVTKLVLSMLEPVAGL